MKVQKPQLTTLSVTRSDLEDFLYYEAALLDAWQLDDWIALFTEDAQYWVPPAGSSDDVEPKATLFYVADDYFRLTERVKRLGKKTAHVEWPKSKCRHLVTNVRILEGTDESFSVTSNFVTYRSKGGSTETYLGHHIYYLRLIDGDIKIRKKVSFLDVDNINEQGKVSIII
ncbi:MAG: aromatic-ring-hydroxylating dioxygenase subunit beta [Pseudomonadales bacterium]|nr:aromatic-ring-hydroxylating dioxygenase subunit beta [Pseudomonadales bacterium]